MSPTSPDGKKGTSAPRNSDERKTSLIKVQNVNIKEPESLEGIAISNSQQTSQAHVDSFDASSKGKANLRYRKDLFNQKYMLTQARHSGGTGKIPSKESSFSAPSD
jgi:hypothetical protein